MRALGRSVAAAAAAAALFGTGVSGSPAPASTGPSGAPAPAAPSAAPSDTIDLGDDMGRTVRFAGPPERIVSLVPPFTEILFALDAGERVVGRTRYGVHPPEARSVPSVGEGMRPSLELVTAREPDVVLLYAGAANRSTVDRLEELGTPALALRHDGLDDLYRNVRRLGRLTGRGEEAAALVDRIRCRLEAVAGVTASVEPVAVYYEVWADPPITVGAGSYLDSLLTVAGGHNVFGGLEGPSPRVSLEAVAERRPDVVLVSERRGEGTGTPPSERPGWEVLEPIREGRVHRVDGDLVHRLGPRLGAAAASLAATLHPGLETRLREALETSCRARPAGRGGARPPGPPPGRPPE